MIAATARSVKRLTVMTFAVYDLPTHLFKVFNAFFCGVTGGNFPLLLLNDEVLGSADFVRRREDGFPIDFVVGIADDAPFDVDVVRLNM